MKRAAGRPIDLSDIEHLEKIKSPFNPADRTYHVSEERLRAFMALTQLQRLQWVEQVAYFLRLAKASKENQK